MCDLFVAVLRHFEKLGYVADLQFHHGFCSFDLVYNFSMKIDRKGRSKGEPIVIGRVLAECHAGVGNPGYGVYVSSQAFVSFKNGRSPEVLCITVGDSGYTEEEALRLIFLYYWGRTVDLFRGFTTEIAKVNSLNPRLGGSLERLMLQDMIFFLQTGISFLGGAGHVLCERLGVDSADGLSCVVLPAKEKGTRAPVKTDVIISAGGIQLTRLSVKCAQTTSSMHGLSVLGTGVRSKSGMREIIALDHPEAGKIFRELNRLKAFRGQETIRQAISPDQLREYQTALEENYPALAKLALLGDGNPYSKDPDSVANFFAEFCLQDGSLVCFSADEFRTQLSVMSVQDIARCFPISGTSRRTARVTFNASMWAGLGTQFPTHVV